MGLYSPAKLFCQGCGREILVVPNSPWYSRACSYICWEEIKWREVLSLMGKEYHPHKDAETWKTHFMQREYNGGVVL